MWHAVSTPSEIPADRDLRLAVINRDGVHALVFPCRRADSAWVDARTRRIVEVYPTHWQDWTEAAEVLSAAE